MIIAGMMLVVLAGAAKIIRGGEGRPSLRRTFLGLPLVVIGLSFPFFLEEGCLVPYNRSYVVTRDADGILTTHALVAWCPRRCVNAPREIGVRATVRRNTALTFEAMFEVKDPRLLVRFLGLDEEDRTVSSNAVEAAASEKLKPLLDRYFTTPDGLRVGAYGNQFEPSILQGSLTSYWEAVSYGYHGLGQWKEQEPVPSSWLEVMGLSFLTIGSEEVGVVSQ